MAANWCYKIGDQVFGPIPAKELRALADTGVLSPNDFVKKEDSDRWITAHRLSGLFKSPQVHSVKISPKDIVSEGLSSQTEDSPNDPTYSLLTPGETSREPRRTNTVLIPMNNLIELPTKNDAPSIALHELQQSAILGVLAAMPSWFFFGNLMHIIFGGAIAGVAVTFAALRFRINTEGYPATLLRFIATSILIVLISWWMGTVNIPFASSALLIISWITKTYTESNLARHLQRQLISRITNIFKTPQVGHYLVNLLSELFNKFTTTTPPTFNPIQEPTNNDIESIKLPTTKMRPFFKSIAFSTGILLIIIISTQTKCETNKQPAAPINVDHDFINNTNGKPTNDINANETHESMETKSDNPPSSASTGEQDTDHLDRSSPKDILKSMHTAGKSDAYKKGFEYGLWFAKQRMAIVNQETRPFAREIELRHLEESAADFIDSMNSNARQLRELGNTIDADNQQGAGDGFKYGITTGKNYAE